MSIIHVTPYTLEEAVTLRELHERITQILAEHPHRADQKVVMSIEQDRTPAGRLRPEVQLPVRFACSGGLGVRDGNADKITVCSELKPPMRHPMPRS